MNLTAYFERIAYDGPRDAQAATRWRVLPDGTRCRFRSKISTLTWESAPASIRRQWRRSW